MDQSVDGCVVTVFKEVREKYKDLCESDISKNIYSVVDREGKFLFCMFHQCNCKNAIYFEEFTDFDLNIDKRYLNLQIFVNYDCVVFFEFEEYTCVLATIIQRHYPNIEVIFLDDNARFLKNDVKIFKNVYEIKKRSLNEKCMFVIEGIQQCQDIIPQVDLNVYTSLQLMQYVFMFKNVKRFGDKNPDKIFWLISLKCGNSGMVDILCDIMVRVWIAKDKGFHPVVHITDSNCQYNVKLWDSFVFNESQFKDEIFDSQNVIVDDCDYIGANDRLNNLLICIKRMMMRNSPYSYLNDFFGGGGIVIRDFAISKIKKILPLELFDNHNKIIGIIARGTDFRAESFLYRNNGSVPISIQNYLIELNHLLKINKFDFAFVATEEKEYLELIKDNLDCKVLSVEQDRVTFDSVHDRDKWVRELFESNAKDASFDYLAVLYALSLCDGLVSNMESGAYVAAHWFSTKRFYPDTVIRMTSNKLIGE